MGFFQKQGASVTWEPAGRAEVLTLTNMAVTRVQAEWAQRLNYYGYSRDVLWYTERF